MADWRKLLLGALEVHPNSLDLTSSGNLTGNEAGTTAI
jgi:hypothetical protein